MVEPRHVHLVATKHVMRYLKGTLDCGIRYAANNEFRLYGYTDSDWVGSVEDKNTNSRCCLSLGSGVISWIRINKTSVTLNTCEAKHNVSFSSCSEVV